MTTTVVRTVCEGDSEGMQGAIYSKGQTMVPAGASASIFAVR